jgi:hypothetical protein
MFLDALNAIKTRFGCTLPEIKQILKVYDSQISSGAIWPDMTMTMTTTTPKIAAVKGAEKVATIKAPEVRCNHNRNPKLCWECRPGKQIYFLK